MKRLRLAILLLLIPLCAVAFAALSKTSTIEDSEVDPWQEVESGTLVVGNVGDISGSYRTIVYLLMAYVDIDGQDGVPVKIETSYGDDTWILLKEFTTPELAGGAETKTLDGDVNSGSTVITLTSAAGFDVIGQKWFIEDDANSEAVRTKSELDDDVTLCHDTLKNHQNLDIAWDTVHEYIIPIPASFAAFRVTIHNIDGDASIYFTTRKSEVEEL